MGVQFNANIYPHSPSKSPNLHFRGKSPKLAPPDSLILPPDKTLFWHRPLLGGTKSVDFLPGNTSSWTQIQAGKIKMGEKSSE
jgi:hypothetical protein